MSFNRDSTVLPYVIIMLGTDDSDNPFCKDRFIVTQSDIAGSFVFTISKEEERREGGGSERGGKGVREGGRDGREITTCCMHYK